jgi:hypothetical protein
MAVLEEINPLFSTILHYAAITRKQIAIKNHISHCLNDKHHGNLKEIDE